MDIGHSHAADAQEHRSVVCCRPSHGRRGLRRIGRDDDSEARDGAHPRKILRRVVRGTEFAVGHSRALPAQDDVMVGVRHIDLDLLHGARGQEAGGRRDERDAPAGSKTRGYPDHGLLGDADVDEALGEALSEVAELARPDRVIDDRDDSVVVCRYVDQRARKGITTVMQCRHVARTSARAAAVCSGLGTRWCQAGSSDMKETGCPLCVCAMKAVGRPATSGVLPRAARSCS